MKIGGPVAQWGEETADERMITSADPTGRHVLGTLNNCAMGFTPWGTYLACEENFNGYFRKTGALTQLEQRYGINSSGAGYMWHTTDSRFDVNQEPNEINRFGWVVEFDPFNPRSTPVKRTALGRMKHEGAWVQEARDGRLVVYMGDDEQFEYIYRYVSNRRWRSAVARGINPLDNGILYVARFDANGTGEWLSLVPGTEGLEDWSLNDILINTRTAADQVGATPMDRPEWIDTFPESLTVVGTLTNNSARGITGTNPRTGQPNSGVDASNPRGDRPSVQHPLATRTDTSSAGSTRTISVNRRSTGISSRWRGSWRSGSQLDDQRRQVRVARRHLRRTERTALDPDRRVGEHDQYRQLRWFWQQPDAVRRSNDRRGPAVPRRSEVLRGHWCLRDAGRANDVRRHSAPG